MPWQRWRNFKPTSLQSRSDGDGLGSVHASGKSGAFGQVLLRDQKHGNGMLATNIIQTAIAEAPAADNSVVKSP